MKRVLKLTVGLVALLLLAVAGLRVLGSFRAREARRAWAETLGSLDDFEKRYPDRPANAAARELERLAVPLGIRLGPPGQPGRAVPAKVEEELFAAFRKGELKAFVDGLSRRDDELAAPSPGVVAFRRRHAPEIEAVIAHVLASDAIQWQRSVRTDTPLPNLLGLRDLSSVIVVEALERHRGGDAAGALRALEANWTLNADFREALVLISQMLRIALDRIQFGAMRRMGPLPEAWQRRVTEHDHRQGLLISLQGDVLTFAEYARQHERHWRENESAWGWMGRLVYSELSLSNYSDLMRESILRLRETSACPSDPALFQEDLRVSIPWWNVPARIAFPGVTRAWLHATEAALDAELTAHVLRARAIEAERGAWPKEAVASAVCPRAAWSRTVSPEGTLTIALDGMPPAFERVPQPFQLRRTGDRPHRTSRRGSSEPFRLARTSPASSTVISRRRSS